MSDILTVWLDTTGGANKYRCASDLYLFIVIPSSYSIIMVHAINSPGHGNYVVYGLNKTENVI